MLQYVFINTRFMIGLEVSNCVPFQVFAIFFSELEQVRFLLTWGGYSSLLFTKHCLFLAQEELLFFHSPWLQIWHCNTATVHLYHGRQCIPLMVSMSVHCVSQVLPKELLVFKYNQLIYAYMHIVLVVCSINSTFTLGHICGKDDSLVCGQMHVEDNHQNILITVSHRCWTILN